MPKYEAETTRLTRLLAERERERQAAEQEAARLKAREALARERASQAGVVYPAPSQHDGRAEPLLTTPLLRKLHRAWGDDTRALCAELGIRPRELDGRECWPLLSVAAAFASGAFGPARRQRVLVACVREPGDFGRLPGAGFHVEPGTATDFAGRLLREPLEERFRLARGELRRLARRGAPAWEQPFETQQLCWACADLADASVPADSLDLALPLLCLIDGGRAVVTVRLSE